MDPYSHRMANALVDNDAEAAALEVTLVGPELQFDDERLVAVAGARFELALDGKAISADSPFLVTAGASLQFGGRLRGARAYVAVSGGIATSPVFGSRATHVASAMGGLDGRMLRSGDSLPLGPRRPFKSWAQARSHSEIPDGHATLRVLAGPQSERFDDGALAALQSAPYRIGSDSNRMGFRLQGPSLAHAGRADIISDATPLGALQVPASGQPILLMADRQTSGGYPKIATVISADIGLAGQLSPGDTVSFVLCSPKEALSALIARERAVLASEVSR
jgi:antagonist of KipI